MYLNMYFGRPYVVLAYSGHGEVGHINTVTGSGVCVLLYRRALLKFPLECGHPLKSLQRTEVG